MHARPDIGYMNGLECFHSYRVYASECKALRTQIEHQKHLRAKDVILVDSSTITDTDLSFTPGKKQEILLKDAAVMTTIVDDVVLLDKAVMTTTSGDVLLLDKAIQVGESLTREKDLNSQFMSADNVISQGIKHSVTHRRSFSDGVRNIPTQKSYVIMKKEPSPSTGHRHSPIPRSDKNLSLFASEESRISKSRTVINLTVPVHIPSGSSVDKLKKTLGESAHKCLWQQQVKSLQQRLRSFRKKVISFL